MVRADKLILCAPYSALAAGIEEEVGGENVLLFLTCPASHNILKLIRFNIYYKICHMFACYYAGWKVSRSMVWKSKTRRTDDVSLGLSTKAGEDYWRPMSHLEDHQAERERERENSFLLSLLLDSGLQHIKWGLSTLVRTICLHGSPTQMLISSKNILTDTPE